MEKDIETIKQVFDKHGVRLILVYGLLLGMYRDKKPLPDDDDVDFAVIDKIDLKTRKSIGWMLYDLGFQPQPIAFNVFGRMEPSEPAYNGDGETGIIVCERNFKFTIFFFKEEECDTHGKEYVCTPKVGSVKLIATPSKFYDKLGEIKVGKHKFLTPSPVEEYLAFTYFENWKDKLDRRHGLTFFEMHGKEMLDTAGQNNSVIYK